MGVTDTRQDLSKKSGFTFENIGDDAPAALQYWFYPGWSRGIKFVYRNDKPSTPWLKQAALQVKEKSETEFVDADKEGETDLAVFSLNFVNVHVRATWALLVLIQRDTWALGSPVGGGAWSSLAGGPSSSTKIGFRASAQTWYPLIAR